MAQIECGRGHLYDPEKYAVCPYCNANQPPIKVAAANRTAPIWGGTRVTAPQKTAPAGAVSVTAPQKTAPIKGQTPVTAPQKTAPLTGRTPVTAPQKTAPPRNYQPMLEQTGQTEPRRVTDSGKTVGIMQQELGFDPVVGWLACVEGPSRGKSYSIYGGINSVGRSDRMDITITGDMKISAENHVRISYSDKNNRFRLIPGDGRNIVYLNGEELFSPMPLEAYDLIDFGETKLLFIPLCGERFTWEQRETEAGHGPF